jgi:Uncharacterized conserved protein H4 (DUF2046)
MSNMASSEIENRDPLVVPTHPHRQGSATQSVPASDSSPRINSALSPRPQQRDHDVVARHTGSHYDAHHHLGDGAPGSPQTLSPTGGRWPSLSPPHGVRRDAPIPSLPSPGNKGVAFLATADGASISAPAAVASSSDSHQETPPRISDTQRAMEAAVAAERKRARELEEQEMNSSADELRATLKQERRRTAGFARTIAQLRSTAVSWQSEAEMNEEGRVNALMRRLETMQIEKGRIIDLLEREEEMLTNTLQKKLTQVRKEKSELQKLIQSEHASNCSLRSRLHDLQGAGDDSENTSTGRGEGDSIRPSNGASTFVRTTLPPLEHADGDDEEDDETSEFDYNYREEEDASNRMDT